jgi:hypothetical protein
MEVSVRVEVVERTIAKIRSRQLLERLPDDGVLDYWFRFSDPFRSPSRDLLASQAAGEQVQQLLTNLLAARLRDPGHQDPPKLPNSSK